MYARDSGNCGRGEGGTHTQTRLTPDGQENLETTEREGVDFLTELLDLVGWSQVNDEETDKDLS